MPFESRVSELVRWNAKKGRIYVRTISMELAGEARDRVGRIFGTLAVEGQPRTGDSLAAFVEDALSQGITDSLRRLPKDAGQEQVFQTAVAKVNHTLSRLLDGEGLPVAPEKVTGAVISQKGLEIVAACWGQPSLLLFHTAGGKTTIIDLLADSDESTPYVGRPASRGFANMISGRMGRNDRLVASTRDLREIFGEEKLRTIIADNDPEAATHVLKDTLSPMGDAVALAVLVADAVSAQETGKARVLRPATPSGTVTTQSSIDQLLTTQSSTKDILAPRFLPSLLKKVSDGTKAGLRALWSTTKKVLTAELTLQPNTRIEDTVEIGASMEWVDATPKAPFPRLRSAGKKTAAVLVFLPSLLRREKRAEVAASMDQGVDQFLNAIIEWFNSQSTKSRLLLFAAFALLFALNQSVMVISWQHRQEDKIAAYEKSVTAVQQKIDSSEASLIYHDEDRAKSLLKEALVAAGALPNKTDAEKQTVDVLRRKIAASFEALRHAVALPAPEVLASIVSGTEAAQLRRLAVTGGSIWTVTTAGELFKISPENGAAAKAGEAKNADVFISQIGGILAGGKDGLSLIPPSGKTSNQIVDWAGVETTIDDADLYGSRLYILDSTHNRILRLPATAKGFAKPQFYAKDGTDFSSAVSLALDGSIYVLAKDGVITRLEQGLRKDFGVEKADPPVSSAAKLRTTEKSESLYVLERSPGRILRFNKKSGALTAQYTSDSLSEANDFSVDEKAGTILAAAGNRVLRFVMPPLK